MINIIKQYYHVSLLAFFSGFILLFPSLILTAYLLDHGLSLTQVGWVSLLATPYLCSFLWMPVIDYWVGFVSKPLVMSGMGLLLACKVLLFGLINPVTAYMAVLCLGLMVAMIASTLDHVIEAYRLAILPKERYRIGVSISLVWFRLGVVFAGGGGLMFAAYYGWTLAYQVASMVIFLLSILILFLPVDSVKKPDPLSIYQRKSIQFLKQVFGHKDFLRILVTHRFSIFWLELMLPVFLMRWMGVSVFDVGVLYKVYGMIGLILGGVIVNVWIKRTQLLLIMQRGLCVQAGICLIFASLTLYQVPFFLLSFIVLSQCCLQGVLSTASTVWLMEKTHPDLPAFSFAIWYGLSGVGRVVVGPVAALIIEHVGWGCYMSLGALWGIYAIYALRRYALNTPYELTGLSFGVNELIK